MVGITLGQNLLWFMRYLILGRTKIYYYGFGAWDGYVLVVG